MVQRLLAPSRNAAQGLEHPSSVGALLNEGPLETPYGGTRFFKSGRIRENIQALFDGENQTLPKHQ